MSIALRWNDIRNTGLQTLRKRIIEIVMTDWCKQLVENRTYFLSDVLCRSRRKSHGT